MLLMYLFLILAFLIGKNYKIHFLTSLKKNILRDRETCEIQVHLSIYLIQYKMYYTK